MNASRALDAAVGNNTERDRRAHASAPGLTELRVRAIAGEVGRTLDHARDAGCVVAAVDLFQRGQQAVGRTRGPEPVEEAAHVPQQARRRPCASLTIDPPRGDGVSGPMPAAPSAAVFTMNA